MAQELMELVESMDAERASVRSLFQGEGTSVRSIGTRREQDAQYRVRLRETARFMADIYSGKRPLHQLKEALTTADFPLLFGDVIDRQLLANYREIPATYRQYCKRGTVADFRTVKRFAINGAESRLSVVAQQEEYPETKLTDAVFSYAVQKYGKAIPFSWEAMINDDLDALKDIPARFGRSARRTEEFFATNLFVDSNGPLAAFFSTANKNRIHTENGAASNNPPLSIAALQDAMTVLAAQVDADGEPISIDSVVLVVPPALSVVAQNILNATELWLTGVGGTAVQQVHTNNWMKGQVVGATNYYIPKIATTNGGTSWFLFADPSDSRPAIEVGFLRGHEDPEVFMKDPNSIRLGGGAATPMDGDFDTDSIRYKVRHVMGGTLIDPKAAVASNGSGS